MILFIQNGIQITNFRNFSVAELKQEAISSNIHYEIQSKRFRTNHLFFSCTISLLSVFDVIDTSYNPCFDCCHLTIFYT